MKSRTSFVIRTKNEEKWIGHAIQSVIDFSGPDTEIIIVDNESDDDTLEIVNLFPKRFYNIKVFSISRKDYTPGRSLNLGIERTSKDTHIVGILSAHCRIINFDKKLIEDKIFNEGYFAVFGKQVPIFRGKRAAFRYVWSNFNGDTPVINPLENLDFKRYFFHNAFSFIRKDTWRNEKFDEDLSGKEDRYWAEKNVLKGEKYLLEPSLICEHYWTSRGATWR